jgi:hypothetical protein
MELLTFFSIGFYSPYRTLAFLNGLLDSQTFGRTPWLGDQSNTRPPYLLNITINIRYPKQLLDYRPIGRRRPGRPLKRLPDGYSSETETGHLLAQLRDQKKKKSKIIWQANIFLILQNQLNFVIVFNKEFTRFVSVKLHVVNVPL